MDVKHRGKKVVQEEEKDEKAKPVLLADQPLNKRWRGFAIRTVSTVALLGSFALIISLGHIALSILVGAVTVKVFHEIVSIGYTKEKEVNTKLPVYRTTQWFFATAACFFFWGVPILGHYASFFESHPMWSWIPRHHTFVSFALYCWTFVLFVLRLRKGQYRYQFSQFAWTHVGIITVLIPGSFVIKNIFWGIIWFLLPALMIVCNDIMAYVFGFALGRTQLIKLSPKKTWEGFIGGFLSTLVFAWFASAYMAQFKFLVCPREDWMMDMDCEFTRMFLPEQYAIPSVIVAFMRLVFSSFPTTITCLPLQWHALVLSAFASSIGPFGGFFASGFKRGYKIKDFAETIPGHGGVTDRMDCQMLMGVFTYVYYLTFLHQGVRFWGE